ncbi:winged helix-turn-helix transcriptional regulator [Exiguobacterium sp. SH1S21]|uniref:replication/maintenance protein RepL n=1 Tax=Exiguobacterium sp. SH1S21 TaxID=2510953 RepID=UPI00103E8824|nr:replication/maintenance protein RepL [Exiguobacterium sp. SH1S21]TCI50255.1 winged helix-turn-helix transcriptional regulator [Exiguobacterium sp. SH1S21]
MSDEKKKFDKNLEYHSDTQTLLGTKQKIYIDAETGEKIHAEQITKRAYGQKQFWKIYLMDFLQVLGVLDSKQVDVFVYILENTEQANNTFIGSQRDIATACGVSLDTVSRIMKKLQENGFVKQIKRSVYQISPNVMLKGSEHKKSLLLNYYDDSTEEDEKTE